MTPVPHVQAARRRVGCRRRVVRVALAAVTAGCGAVMASSIPRATAPPSGAEPRSSQIEATLGETIVLALGQSASIGSGELSVRVERIVEDSRCPVGVTCVWEGDAVVRLAVTRGPSTSTVDLHLNLDSARERVVGAYRVRLADLLPRPVGTKPVEPSAYRVHLVVTR